MQDGKRWDKEAVLRASGAPLLIFELLGTSLTVHGAYTIEGNVMASEPLTPRLLLLPMDDRMEQPGLQLARVLAGLEAAMRLLQRRMSVMAGEELHPPHLAQPLEDLGMSAEYKAALLRALDWATLVGDAAQAPAARRQKELAAQLLLVGASGPFQSQQTWAHLPYPLARKAFSSVKAVPGYAERPLFICDEPELGRVLVKFTRREYPDKASPGADLVCG